jgi:hypothetical protein
LADSSDYITSLTSARTWFKRRTLRLLSDEQNKNEKTKYELEREEKRVNKMASTVPPNLEFTKLGPASYLYTPPTSSKPLFPTDPTTIVVLPWMGVSMRSRALNAAFHKHHALYPAARIVVALSDPMWYITTPVSTRRNLVSPAVTAIEADPAAHDQRNRVLVHLFSNGGTTAFMELCVVYKARFNRRLSIKALALDSAPGKADWPRGWRAMKVGLPKGILWFPAALLMGIVFLFTWIWVRVLKLSNLVDEARHCLSEFDVMDRTSKRLYLYGTKDKLIDPRIVEMEVRKARDLGLEVSIYKNERDPHVQYMIHDGERYWKAIEALWDSTRNSQ